MISCFSQTLPTKNKQDPKVLFNLGCDVRALVVATVEAVMMVVVMMVVVIPPIPRHDHDRRIVIAIAGIEGVVMVMMMVVMVELGDLNVGIGFRRRSLIDRLQQSPSVGDRLEQLGI